MLIQVPVNNLQLRGASIVARPTFRGRSRHMAERNSQTGPDGYRTAP